MEICKAPTLRFKALNKHTHIMYIEMENVIKKYIYKKMYISTKEGMCQFDITRKNKNKKQKQNRYLKCAL